MIPPPTPAGEQDRLQALLRLHLLDSPREKLFDTCVQVATTVIGASRGAISLVDRERQWFKAVFGDLPPETARDVSFCGHTIAHDDSPAELEVSVEDDGQPIPESLRERIFEAGFRADEGSKRSGHGLGLAFARQAVALHGGTIEVLERSEGRDNRFVVRLPRRPA